MIIPMLDDTSNTNVIKEDAKAQQLLRCPRAESRCIQMLNSEGRL